MSKMQLKLLTNLSKASFFYTFDDTQNSPTLFSRKYKYKCILCFIENENRLKKPIKFLPIVL